MQKIIIVAVFVCYSCTKGISPDSKIIDLDSIEHWYFNKDKNAYYIKTVEDSILQKTGVFKGELIFKPDTTSVQEQVGYRDVKKQMIPIDSVRQEQVTKGLLYLYIKIDDKSGGLIKINKIDSLVMVRYPSPIYD